MPPKKTPPKYCLHKPSGQARVIINGREFYLGKYGSPESREKYLRLIAEGPIREPPQTTAGDGKQYPDLLVGEVIVAYMKFCRGYYVKDGEPTKEVRSTAYAMRPLRALYASTKAHSFGPKALKAVQTYMIEKEDLSRGVINDRTGRIKRMFEWAVSEELLPASVSQALRTVKGLRRGRTHARETEPVKPVPDALLAATLPYLPPHVQAMVRVQRVTGMRPEDVVAMRPGDIDRADEGAWVYTPKEHKNSWREHVRQIPLGPAAQTIIAPYLNRAAEDHLFSPAEAMQWRREDRRRRKSERKTQVYRCEVRRLERERSARQRSRRSRQRMPKTYYTTGSYYRAVRYAIEKARGSGFLVPFWYPNQIRHTRGTEVRHAFGLEAAQVILGNAQARVTEIYAERNIELARDVARRTG